MTSSYFNKNRNRSPRRVHSIGGGGAGKGGHMAANQCCRCGKELGPNSAQLRVGDMWACACCYYKMRR